MIKSPESMGDLPVQLLVILSVLLYVLLGVPVWYNTTVIPRPWLPHREMQNNSLTVKQTLLPVHIRLYVVGGVLGQAREELQLDSVLNEAKKYLGDSLEGIVTLVPPSST